MTVAVSRFTTTQSSRALSQSDSLADKPTRAKDSPPSVASTWDGARGSVGHAFNTFRAISPQSLVVPTKVALTAACGLACAAAMYAAARTVVPTWGTETRAATLAAGWGGICYAKEALFGARHDGHLVPCNTIMRLFLPFLIETCNTAGIKHKQKFCLKRTVPFIKKWNAEHPASQKIGIFEIVVAAVMRANLLHPGLDRFVAGERLFDRNEFSMGISVKPKRTKFSRIRTAKLTAKPGETFEQLVDRLYALKNGEVKKRQLNTSEREMRFFLNLPNPVIRLAVRIYKLLEPQGMWPASLIKDDALYTSVFIANLGSLHSTLMDDVDHHLYDTYGTNSLFGALCSARLTGDKPRVKIKWAYDERVNDGHYCVWPLGEAQALIENPERLLETLTAEQIAEARVNDLVAGRCAYEEELDQDEPSDADDIQQASVGSNAEPAALHT